MPYIEREEPVVVERGSGLTGYAVAKYGFILLIVIVVLFFIARFVLG
jgi:hypothetical protein